MGLRFSCLQITKPNKTPKIIYKPAARSNKRIPPPRNNSTNENTIASKVIPPQRKNKLCEYHATNITKTKTATANNNNLCVPSNIVNMRDASLTYTTSNISALSSAASVISTLSSNTNIPTPSLETSSETSVSILTSQNETSISSSITNDNVDSDPVSPSPTDHSDHSDYSDDSDVDVSPMNMTIARINNNIELTANRLSMTTQLSQLTGAENVKVITLTQTMDIQDIKPTIYKMYNGGLIAVKSTSVTSPIVENSINPIYSGRFGINDISKCLQNDISKCLQNDIDQSQYCQQYID